MAVVHNNKLSNAWYQDNTSDSNKKTANMAFRIFQRN
jgi:hypothetical protein